MEKYNSIVFYLVLLCVDACYSVSQSSQFIHLKALDNLICPSDNVVFTKYSVSLTTCMATCTNSECQSAFYVPIESKCFGCSDIYTTPSALQSLPGTKYYQAADADLACNTPINDHRLCDGTSQGVRHASQGRIEVYYNATWWAICNDCWDSDCDNNSDLNREVVCNLFGHNGGNIYPKDYFGHNTTPLLLDNVRCTGNEGSLLSCPANQPIGPPIACSLKEAVGVECYSFMIG